MLSKLLGSRHYDHINVGLNTQEHLKEQGKKKNKHVTVYLLEISYTQIQTLGICSMRKTNKQIRDKVSADIFCIPVPIPPDSGD